MAISKILAAFARIRKSIIFTSRSSILLQIEKTSVLLQNKYSMELVLGNVCKISRSRVIASPKGITFQSRVGMTHRRILVFIFSNRIQKEEIRDLWVCRQHDNLLRILSSNNKNNNVNCLQVYHSISLVVVVVVIHSTILFQVVQYQSNQFNKGHFLFLI